MKTPATQSTFTSLAAPACALLLALLAPAARADSTPPDRITYQGYLSDSAGTALGNTSPKNYDVIFRMYDALTGGNRLWSEQQTVTIDKGYFSVLLGEGTQVSSETHPSLATLFVGPTASERYVEITVKGASGSSDTTIAPRLRLLTAPYAYLASQATTASSLGNVTNVYLTTTTDNQVLFNTTNTVWMGGASVIVGATNTLSYTNASILSFNVRGQTGTNAATFSMGVGAGPDPRLRVLLGYDYRAGYDYGFIGAWQSGLGGKPLSINPNGANVHLCTSGGNVGIGTTECGTANPLANDRLTVNGSINAWGWLDLGNWTWSGSQWSGVNFASGKYIGGSTRQNAVWQMGFYQDGATGSNDKWFVGRGGVSTYDLTVNQIGQVGVNCIVAIGTGWQFYANGNAGGSTGWNSASDRRLKKDIHPITNALAAVTALKGVTYNWDKTVNPTMKLDDGNHLGFLAQDVEAVLPQAVHTAGDAMHTKSLTYTEIIPVLNEAIKEQQTQIEQLKATVAELKAAVAALQAAK